MTTVGIPLNTGEQATDKMPQAKHVAGSRVAPTLHNSCFHMYVKFPVRHVRFPRGRPHLSRKWGGETTQNLEDVPGTLENA